MNKSRDWNRKTDMAEVNSLSVKAFLFESRKKEATNVGKKDGTFEFEGETG